MLNSDPPPPFLTRAESREVDRRAIDEYGFTGLVLMENAGRGCADVLCQRGIEGPIVICCGKGNNGGDGLVIARHLDLRGFHPRVLLCCDPGDLRGDALANFEIARRINLAIVHWHELPAAEVTRELTRASWIVDALLGTGAVGEPRAPISHVIPLINEASARTLAVDVPSGLDCETGEPARQTVRATVTCTFVCPKIGFRAPAAAPYLGSLQVLDIGAPARLFGCTGILKPHHPDTLQPPLTRPASDPQP